MIKNSATPALVHAIIAPVTIINKITSHKLQSVCAKRKREKKKRKEEGKEGKEAVLLPQIIAFYSFQTDSVVASLMLSERPCNQREDRILRIVQRFSTSI